MIPHIGSICLLNIGNRETLHIMKRLQNIRDIYIKICNGIAHIG